MSRIGKKPVSLPQGVSATVSGQTVTDAAGNAYPMQPGEYRFPLVPIGNYRLAITPPAPYHAPSTTTPAQVSGIIRPDGSNVTILDGSYGGVFAITSPSPVRIDIPVDRPPVAVALTKSVSQANAMPGDLIYYTITARNTDPVHIKRGVVVSDTPSPLLRLRKDSIRLNGTPSPANVTISANGRALAVNLGDIAPGATRTITYAMTVRLTAPPGQALNKAMATDARGTTAYASATLTVEPDTLDSRMTLVGRITDGDCTRDGPHVGIPGVRVILEDGSFAVTDREGRYHFNGLVPGDHVVQVASETLPDGGKFVNCGRSTRNARSAISTNWWNENSTSCVAVRWLPTTTVAFIALLTVAQCPQQAGVWGLRRASLPVPQAFDVSDTAALPEEVERQTAEARRGEGGLVRAPASAFAYCESRVLREAFRVAILSPEYKQACDRLDMVVLGSPHFSLGEFRQLAALLSPAVIEGKRCHPDVQFLVTSSRAVVLLAKQGGYLAPLEAFGGRVTVDTCILASPMLPPQIKRLMTNSAKYAYYAPGLLSTQVAFGSLSDCVDSAVAGRIARDDTLWGDL